MTRFEEELHRAVEQRSTAATAVTQSLQRFREHNAPARQEAARRLVQIAEDVRRFLTHHKIPPQQIIAARTTRLRGRHLVHVASGWQLMPYFVTLEGRFVRFTPADIAFGDARPRIKPGQRYLGHYAKAKNPVAEVQAGVGDAIFVPKSKPVPNWFGTEAEFAGYYYTDLSNFSDGLQPPDMPCCPGEALLLTPGGSELRLATLDNEHYVSVSGNDKQIADSALQLVESHRTGRQT